MATADQNAAGESDWRKKESFGKALLQVAIIGVVLIAAVFVYVRGRNTKRDVLDKLKEARTVAMKGNPTDLEAALKLADAALAIDANAADALAFEAAIHTNRWVFYGFAASEAPAKSFLEKSKTANSKSDDRYGSEALHILKASGPKAADDFVEELRKRGAQSPRLLLAQALALKGEGNLGLARQLFGLAMDKAWRDPDFAAANAEALLDEGLLPQATDAVNKALSANPDHLRSRVDSSLIKALRHDKMKDAADTVKELSARDADLSPWLKARMLVVSAEIANVEARYDDAVKAADEALAQNPDEAWAAYVKAKALATKKDPGAAAAFKAAVGKAKTASVMYLEGSALLDNAGDTNGAMELLAAYEETFKDVKMQLSDGTSASALDRDDRYWLTKGTLLKSTGKLDEAIAAYDKAIAAKSFNGVRATYAKAMVFVAKKENDKAAEILADITPQDGTGHLAEAYMAVGDLLFAKKDFPNGCQNYAFALTKMKQLQVPREQLNGIVTDVEKRLKTAGQANIAKLWVEEAKPLIQ